MLSPRDQKRISRIIRNLDHVHASERDELVSEWDAISSEAAASKQPSSALARRISHFKRRLFDIVRGGELALTNRPRQALKP
jgi:hypothetical protein